MTPFATGIAESEPIRCLGQRTGHRTGGKEQGRATDCLSKRWIVPCAQQAAPIYAFTTRLEPGSDRTCETKTDEVVLERQGEDDAIRGRHAVGIAAPIAAPEPTRRAGCAIQIVPLKHVAALVKRAIEAPAATKRAYVSCGADGTIVVVGLIGTAADRGARISVALRGESIVAADACADVIGRLLFSRSFHSSPSLKAASPADFA